MVSEIRYVRFAGLDPVPIRIALAEAADDQAVLAAAGLPPSAFIETVRPYRLQQAAADMYELVIGPDGFGAILLEALQWLSRVAAAGIVGSIARQQVAAFVEQYLEIYRPDWKFEELTEYAEAFINDRYQRAVDDAGYRDGLAHQRETAGLTELSVEIQAWVAR